MCSNILASSVSVDHAIKYAFVLKWLVYVCGLLLLRKLLLKSDWLLWLRYIPNFIFDVSSKEKILNCLVRWSFKAILKHPDGVSTCLDTLHWYKAWFTRYQIFFNAGSLSWIRYKKRFWMWVFAQSQENSPVTLFRGKIISLCPPYLLFSLPICQAIEQPHVHWSHPIIKARFGSVLNWITMSTRKTKRYRLYRIHFYTSCWCVSEMYRIVGAERIGLRQSRINKTPIRYKNRSDT